MVDVPPNAGFPPKMLDPLVLTEVDSPEPPNNDFAWLAEEAGAPKMDEVCCCPPNNDEEILDGVFKGSFLYILYNVSFISIVGFRSDRRFSRYAFAKSRHFC